MDDGRIVTFGAVAALVAIGSVVRRRGSVASLSGVDSRDPVDCLIIVHLSSLDTLCDYQPSECEGLASRMSDAVEGFPGMVIVLDEGWGSPSRPRKQVVRAIQWASRPVKVIWHDGFSEDLEEGYLDAVDEWERWDVGIEDLGGAHVEPWAQLRERLPEILRDNSIEGVILGGVWWHRNDDRGCVNAVEEILRGQLKENGGFLEWVEVGTDLVGEWIE